MSGIPNEPSNPGPIEPDHNPNSSQFPASLPSQWPGYTAPQTGGYPPAAEPGTYPGLTGPYQPLYPGDVPEYLGPPDDYAAYTVPAGPYPPSSPYGYAPLGTGYPPPGLPPDAARSGLRGWQWALLSLTALLVVCCIGSSALAYIHGKTGALAGVKSAATRTPMPSATPTISPTPITSNHGFHMTFGANYRDTGGRLIIVNPQTQFHASDPFAFVVMLDHGIGTPQAHVILQHLAVGGAVTEVFDQTVTIRNPAANEFANKFAHISDVLSGYNLASGNFRLELTNGKTVVAHADFTYLG